jgi:hypothetical protein
MPPESITIIKQPVDIQTITSVAEKSFGDMTKAVVDIDQGIMAIGGELHADEETVLLENGSKQENLWGINIYPALPIETYIEFDSMINIRPKQNNRSRSVENTNTQEQIRTIVSKLITR